MMLFMIHIDFIRANNVMYLWSEALIKFQLIGCLDHFPVDKNDDKYWNTHAPLSNTILRQISAIKFLFSSFYCKFKAFVCILIEHFHHCV